MALHGVAWHCMRAHRIFVAEEVFKAARGGGVLGQHHDALRARVQAVRRQQQAVRQAQRLHQDRTAPASRISITCGRVHVHHITSHQATGLHPSLSISAVEGRRRQVAAGRCAPKHPPPPCVCACVRVARSLSAARTCG